MKRKMNAKKFEKYTPPGIGFKERLLYTLWYLGIAVGWSCSYLVKYMTARSNLYEYALSGLVLREGAVMPKFSMLVQDGMDSRYGFWGFYFLMIVMMVMNYLHYYQGSKSIYLMRRLPDKLEMHRRNVILPMVAIGVGTLTQAALWMLYYGIYLTCTPPQCLPLFY